MLGIREYTSDPNYYRFPCVMVVATSMGKFYAGSGCVISYQGEDNQEVKEVVNEFAGSLEDLFYEGTEPPKEPGIYRFVGEARTHPEGGPNEPVTFHGKFQPIPLTSDAA